MRALPRLSLMAPLLRQMCSEMISTGHQVPSRVLDHMQMRRGCLVHCMWRQADGRTREMNL